MIWKPLNITKTTSNENLYYKWMETAKAHVIKEFEILSTGDIFYDLNMVTYYMHIKIMPTAINLNTRQ